MRFVSIFTILILFLLFSCTNENDISSKIVVEGWIEENKPPIVMLHYTYTFNQNVEHNIEDIIAEHLITWAKVTIDNNEDEEILIGQLDMDIIPPYKYSTARMIGEVGKKYKIKVEYNGETVSATTRLLEKVKIDSIVVTNLHDMDYDVRVYFNDFNTTEEHYYALLYKYLGDKQYSITQMGITKSSLGNNGSLSIIANRRINSLITDSVTNIFFTEGDSIMFKLCHIDSTSYEIWNSYLSQTFSTNIPIATTNNIESNIENGLGYWCGMNGTEQFVVIKHDTTYVY